MIDARRTLHCLPRTGLAVLVAILMAALAGPWDTHAQLVVDHPANLPDFDLSDGVCLVCLATDDDDNCIQPAGCSLFAAIQIANQAADLDVISFAIGTVPNDLSGIPVITSPVRIQGAVGGDRVHIQGPGPSENSPGLLFDGPATAGSEVFDVEISGFPTGIEFRNSPGGIVRNCVVRDNQAAGVGIAVIGDSEGALIGGSTDLQAGNVIVGNGRGILLEGSGNHKVYGNRIGIDADGQAHGNTSGITVGVGAGVGTEIGSGDPEQRNVISNNSNSGISVSGTTTLSGSADVRLLEIYGNYIGTDATGTVAAPNGWGVQLTRTDGVRIGRGEWGDPRGNLISGHVAAAGGFPFTGAGVYLNNRNINTLIEANTIGMGSDMNRLSNKYGVVVRGEAQDVEIEQNWIAGQLEHGVVLARVNAFVPEGNRVLRNYIGIEPEDDMTVENGAMFNGGHGVLVEEAGFNQVSSNEIGNSGLHAISLSGEDASENTIELNRIGTKLNTLSDQPKFFLRPNEENGVSVEGGSNNLILGNWISASAVGISLSGSSMNLIHGNLLGDYSLDEDHREIYAANPISGILLEDGSDDNEIGTSGNGNVCFLGRHCIVIRNGTGNVMRGNTFLTSLEPIDLGDDGITPNDDLDADTGPNQLQNAPFVTDVSYESGSRALKVDGRLDAAPGTTYIIEAFRSEDFGPIRTYPSEALESLGTVEITTDASGAATFSIVSSTIFEGDLRFSQTAVLTATDPGGNTSEARTFSDVELEETRLFIKTLFVQDVPAIPDPAESGEIVTPVIISNSGVDTAEDVELKIDVNPSTGADVQVDRVVIESAPVLCTDEEIPISCLLGDLEGRNELRAVIYGTVSEGALGKRATDFEIRVSVSATINGELVETSQTLISGGVPVSSEAPIQASALELGAPYPSPFTDRTSMRLIQPPTGGDARVVVYDILGRTVRTIEAPQSDGPHIIEWDGRSDTGVRAAPGVYFIALRHAGGLSPVHPVVFRP